jgi:hypothetical protein
VALKELRSHPYAYASFWRFTAFGAVYANEFERPYVIATLTCVFRERSMLKGIAIAAWCAPEPLAPPCIAIELRATLRKQIQEAQKLLKVLRG